MNLSNLRPMFLFSIITLASVLLFFIFKPFLIPLSLAIVFALVLKPVYSYLLLHVPRWPAAASGGTILLAVVCVLVPIFFLGLQIVGEAQDLYTSLSRGGDVSIYTFVSNLLQTVGSYVPMVEEFAKPLLASIDGYTKGFLSWVVSHLGMVFSGVTHILFSLFIFLIALFYLLLDGDKLRKIVVKLSPLADAEDNIVLAKLELAVNSVIKGSLIVAGIQGVLSGIGLALFGVPNPILWGVLAGFTALIPTFGTSIVLLPAVVFLLTQGAIFSALGLLVWAVLAVGLIDNLLGPRLVGKRAQLHPLIVLLSALGGITLFGPAGLILGPLSASLLLALLAIYSDSLVA